MGVFSNDYPYTSVDDFFRATRDVDGSKLNDILTPKHVIFEQLEKKGAVKYAPPGRGQAIDVLYDTPLRQIVLTKTLDHVQYDRTPVEVATRGYYDWIQFRQTLVIGGYEYDNADHEGMTGLMRTRRKALEIGWKNEQVRQLWNGFVPVGGPERLFGITDAVRYVPGTESTKGAIGGLPIANYSTWKNQANDFAGAFKTVASGEVQTTFLDKTNGLRELYRDCSDNVMRTAPDLIAMNAAGDDFCANLVMDKLLFRDTVQNQELGVSNGFRFMDAMMYYDRDCPTETAAEGTFFVLNTDSFDICYATGLTNAWEPMKKVDGQASLESQMKNQWMTRWYNLRCNGVLHGVQAV